MSTLQFKGYHKEDMPDNLKLEFITDYLERYLKNDGACGQVSDLSPKRRTLPLSNGLNIQYVNWITSDYRDADDVEDDEEVAGWSDEIVYVGTQTSSDDPTPRKCFIGMHYKHSADAKITLFGDLDSETFDQVLFTVMMHDVPRM